MSTKRPKVKDALKGNYWVRLSTRKVLDRITNDPFNILSVPRTVASYAGVKPIEFVPNDDRDRSYDIGRIAYLIKNGWKDPVVMDWLWQGMYPTHPVITDGHHRLCAAALLGERHVVVSYSGPLDEVSSMR